MPVETGGPTPKEMGIASEKGGEIKQSNTDKLWAEMRAKLEGGSMQNLNPVDADKVWAEMKIKLEGAYKNSSTWAQFGGLAEKMKGLDPKLDRTDGITDTEWGEMKAKLKEGEYDDPAFRAQFAELAKKMKELDPGK